MAPPTARPRGGRLGTGGWRQTGWDVSAPTPSGGWVAEPAMDASDSPARRCPRMRSGTAPILVRPGRAATRSLRRTRRRPGVARGDHPARRGNAKRVRRRTKPKRRCWGSMDDPLASQASVRDLSGTRLHRRIPPVARLAWRSLAAQVLSDEANVTPEEAPALHDGYGSTNEFANPLAAAEEAPCRGGGPGQGVIGEALEGSTPLSPADLGTLASIGVDPGDGVGALRLLAVLIRILNRNQLIEPADLREEIRESRAQGAAVAVQEPYGMESQGAASEDAGGPWRRRKRRTLSTPFLVSYPSREITFPLRGPPPPLGPRGRDGLLLSGRS